MPRYTVWGLQLISFCMSVKSSKCHMKSSNLLRLNLHLTIFNFI
ncbi:unnamed protein product [Brassica rapa]|uniref:Uncharacterized protein n=2 Tax=Brassica TaxID=3705 RepID=A0A8D9G508_BRACM|nr:unnamed protein product [Brassica napus]CAG7868246.1 unnamed protein product [Brassica rapa]